MTREELIKHLVREIRVNNFAGARAAAAAAILALSKPVEKKPVEKK